MLTNFTTPTPMPRSRRIPTILPEGPSIRDMLFELHQILVNPSATPAEAKSAKLGMLNVLGGTVRDVVPHLTVVPTSESLERELEVTLFDEIPDNAPAYEEGECPLIPLPILKRPPFTQSRVLALNFSKPSAQLPSHGRLFSSRTRDRAAQQTERLTTTLPVCPQPLCK